MQVTWTKLFVFTGALIAGIYAITAYMDSIAENRQASLSHDLASLRKDLDDIAVQLTARGGEANDRLRKDLLGIIEQRAAHAEERLDGFDSKLSELRTDVLTAIAKIPAASTVPPSTP
jgi:hypothetical protein